MVSFRALLIFLFSGVLMAFLSSCGEDVATPGQKTISARPLVIAHRGASSYLPEHTLEAYRLAVEQGADFIEPDLIITKDGVLITRHEHELSGTTDVAQKFPARKTVKTINGREVEDWFSEDFTLAEIKTLRVNERVPFRDQSNNGKFKIPTFAEVLDLRARLSDQSGRAIGVYPETKHPSYFAALGLSLEEPLVRALYGAGLNHADAPVFIQSFDVANLVKLDTMTEVPLIQLIGAIENQAEIMELDDIAGYAEGIGPAKSMIFPVNREGRAGSHSDLVERAHAIGLLVHPYTFRPEPEFLPERYDGDPALELCAFASLGIDGLFTDAPDVALKAFSKTCPMTGR